MGKKANQGKASSLSPKNTNSRGILLREKEAVLECLLRALAACTKANGKTGLSMEQDNKRAKMGQSMMGNGELEKKVGLAEFIAMEGSSLRGCLRKESSMDMARSTSKMGTTLKGSMPTINSKEKV